MKLVLAVERGRLTRHFGRLFPGAKAPRPGIDPTSYGEAAKERRGREGLIDLLALQTRDVIGADEIEALLGIAQCNLGRETKARIVAEAMDLYGYKLVKAKDLGRAGRMRYLVKKESTQLYPEQRRNRAVQRDLT